MDDVARELLEALEGDGPGEVERAGIALVASAPDPAEIVRAVTGRPVTPERDGLLLAVARYGRGEARELAEAALGVEVPAPVLGAVRTRSMDGGVVLLADVIAGDRRQLAAVTVVGEALVDGILVGDVTDERHAELLEAFAAEEPPELLVATDPAGAIDRIATAAQHGGETVPYDVALALSVIDATQPVPRWERPVSASPTASEGIDVRTAALIDDLTLRFLSQHRGDPEIEAYGPVTVQLLLEHQVLRGSSGSPLEWDPADVASFLLDACPASLPRDRELVLAVPRIVRAFLRFAAGATSDPETTRGHIDAVVDHLEPQYAALTAPLLTPPSSRAADDPDRRRREHRRAQRAARKRTRRSR